MYMGLFGRSLSAARLPGGCFYCDITSTPSPFLLHVSSNISVLNPWKYNGVSLEFEAPGETFIISFNVHLPGTGLRGAVRGPHPSFLRGGQQDAHGAGEWNFKHTWGLDLWTPPAYITHGYYCYHLVND